MGKPSIEQMSRERKAETALGKHNQGLRESGRLHLTGAATGMAQAELTQLVLFSFQNAG